MNPFSPIEMKSFLYSFLPSFARSSEYSSCGNNLSSGSETVEVGNLFESAAFKEGAVCSVEAMTDGAGVGEPVVTVSIDTETNPFYWMLSGQLPFD